MGVKLGLDLDRLLSRVWSDGVPRSDESEAYVVTVRRLLTDGALVSE